MKCCWLIASMLISLSPLIIINAKGNESQIQKLYDHCDGNIILFQEKITNIFGPNVIEENGDSIQITFIKRKKINGYKFHGLKISSLEEKSLKHIVDQILQDKDNDLVIWHIRREIEHALKMHGYDHAVVKHKIDNNHILHFYCTLGKANKITAIKIKGSYPSIKTPWVMPFWYDNLNQNIIQSHIQLMLKQMNDLGYFDADISYKVDLINHQATVTYICNSGKQYTFGQVQLIGKWPQDIQKFIPKGAFTRKSYEKFINNVSTYVGDGYVMRHKLSIDQSAKSAQIILNLSAGKVFIIKKITFEGNTRSGITGLRRRIVIREGDLWCPQTEKQLMRRLQQLSDQGIILNPQFKNDGHINFNVQDLPSQHDALALSLSISYSPDEGIDGGAALEFSDKNFADIGPLTLQLIARDTRKGINIFTQYNNIASSDVSGFLALNLYQINHARLFDYMLRTEQFGNYLKFATGTSDLKVGIILPLTQSCNIQPYCGIKHSTFGAIPDINLPILAPTVFPGRSDLNYSIGLNNVYQPNTNLKTSIDLMLSIDGSTPFLTTIGEVKYIIDILMQPFTFDFKIGKIFGGQYWINNFSNQFHCKLLNAVPTSSLCAVGGKSGYYIRATTPIIRKSFWTISAFAESGCIYNSGLDPAQYMIQNDLHTLNMAAGALINISIYGMFPLEFVIGVPIGAGIGIPLFGAVRMHFSLGELL